MPKLACIFVRTIARMREHADKEHSEHDPKIPRQTSLCMLVNCSDFLGALCSCVYLLQTVRVRACVRVCVRACVRGCLPARVGTLQRFHVVPRPQNREPGMVMVTVFQIYLFVFLYFAVLNARAHTHTRTSTA